MPSYADRVQETTTTTGTGTVTLGGAVTGYRTFTSAITTGAKVRYAIVVSGGTDWEVGDGTLLTAGTLSRDNVYSSSNAGALVNFSAGTKNVWVDFPAQAIADVGLTIAIASRIVPQ